jgi:hypothetical protein
MTAKHPPGPPMTLSNMRELSVQRLLVWRLVRSLANREIFDDYNCRT